MNSVTKKPIGITIAGFLSLAAGLFILYRVIEVLFAKPWVQANQGWLEYLNSSPNRFIVIGFLLASGYGLLKLKPWARSTILSVTGFSVLYNLAGLFAFGTYKAEIPLGLIVICVIIIWYFNRKTIKELFPYPKGAKTLKVLTILWVIALILLPIGYYWLWHEDKGDLMPGLKNTVYTHVNTSDSFRTPFPLPYSIEIPNNFKLIGIDSDDERGIWIWLKNPNRDNIFLRQLTGQQQSYNDIAPKFGFESAYNFLQKIYSEKFGLIFVGLKGIEINDDVYSVEESKIDGLNIFVIKARRDTCFEEKFNVYSNGEAKGGGEFLCLKNNEIEKNQQIDNIIASIKPQYKSSKTGPEFFQEGLELYNKGDFEKAKFSFASALCLEWENPEYHYNLARTFFETKSWGPAEHFFAETLKHKKDYPMAQEYLDRTKKEKLAEKKAKAAATEQKRVTL